MRIPTKAAQIVTSEGEQRSHFSLLFCILLFSVEDWTFSQQIFCRQEALGKSITKENMFFQPPTLPYSCSYLAHMLFLFSRSKYSKGELQAYITMLYLVLSSWNKFSICKLLTLHVWAQSGYPNFSFPLQHLLYKPIR